MDADKTTEMCLKEMFKRVGEKYPNKELTDQKDWYTKRTWTQKQEDGFRVWMDKLLKKRHKMWNKEIRGREISMFLLLWGWCNEEEK